MDPTYNTVTVGKILFPLYNTTSSNVIERTAGFTRNSTIYKTMMPFDTLQVTKAITSLTKIEAPVCNISNTLTANNFTLTGPFTGVDATFTGTLTANNFAFTGPLTGSDATFTGTLTANNFAFTGPLTGVDATFTGTLTTNNFVLAGGFSINTLSVGGSASFFSDVTFVDEIIAQQKLYLYNRLSFTGVTDAFIENTASNSSITLSVKNPSNVVINTFRTDHASTTISNNIVQNGTTSSDRQISSCFYNVGDIANLSTTVNGRIYSSGDIMYIQNLKQTGDGSTSFTISTGVSTFVTPLSLSQNTFTIGPVTAKLQSTVPTTYFDMVSNSTGSTFLASRNSSSLNSSIALQATDSSGVLKGISSFSPTAITEYIPTNSSSATATLPSHNGFIDHVNNSPVAIPNNTTVGPIANFTLPSKGVYLILLSIRVSNNSATAGIINDFLVGVNKSPVGGPTQTTSILGGQQASAQYRFRDFTGDLKIFPYSNVINTSSCVIAASDNDIIHINGYLNYTTSPSMLVQVVPTWVKLT